MKRWTTGGLVFLVTTLMAASAFALTSKDLQNSAQYIPVPQIYNQDSYIKKGSIAVNKNHPDGKAVNFLHIEDQGNAVVEYDSQFVYNEAKSELRLKRKSMKQYREDGSPGVNAKMSADFNIGPDTSGYDVYTKLITGEISNQGITAKPANAAPAQNHNILNDNSVKDKWALTGDISYQSIRNSGYNKVYAPISNPFYATEQYQKLADYKDRSLTIKSYIVRGTPKIQRLANGDTKIYYQWIQCDELLPTLLINGAFYFEEASQKLFRYDPKIVELDNATGKVLKTIDRGEASRKECSKKEPAYGDFQRMKAGKFAVN